MQTPCWGGGVNCLQGGVCAGSHLHARRPPPPSRGLENAAPGHPLRPEESPEACCPGWRSAGPEQGTPRRGRVCPLTQEDASEQQDT